MLFYLSITADKTLLLNKKIYIIILLTFTVSTIEIPDYNIDWNDSQRIFQIILIIASSAIIIFKKNTVNLKTAYLVLALGLISSLNAQHYDIALKEWGRYAGLLIITLLTAQLSETKKTLKLILYILAASAFINSFQFIVSYAAAFSTGILKLNADLLLNGFSNPRFLNQFQMLFMPILAYLALHHWQATHRYSKLLAVVLFSTLLIHWCIAFTLGSRGLWLGLAVCYAGLIILFPKFWRLLAVQASAGVLGFTLYYFMFFIVPEWVGIEASVRNNLRLGMSGREVIWQMAWDMFLAHPLLGVGPMHFSAVVNSIAAHPHQVVLQWLAEWGLLATLAAIFVAFSGMLHGLKVIRSNAEEHIDAALWMSILGALALAQVDGVFVMPYTETWLAIIVGLALSRWAKTHYESRWQTYFLRTLAISVIFIFGNVLINEAPTLIEDSKAHMEKHGTGFTPRFWMQGWIPMDGK
ncbi:MAG: O-antigen ligase family protein [Gammaproteobacteria bacterium]|nr:O-antigen ligase family protein [Gammaproteobacteria bacterium]